MTLKTLNKIENINQVKYEAIKWVKARKKNVPKDWFFFSEMLMDFANITEEDLA